MARSDSKLEPSPDNHILDGRKNTRSLDRPQVNGTQNCSASSQRFRRIQHTNIEEPIQYDHVERVEECPAQLQLLLASFQGRAASIRATAASQVERQLQNIEPMYPLLVRPYMAASRGRTIILYHTWGGRLVSVNE